MLFGERGYRCSLCMSDRWCNCWSRIRAGGARIVLAGGSRRARLHEPGRGDARQEYRRRIVWDPLRSSFHPYILLCYVIHVLRHRRAERNEPGNSRLGDPEGAILRLFVSPIKATTDKFRLARRK